MKLRPQVTLFTKIDVLLQGVVASLFYIMIKCTHLVHAMVAMTNHGATQQIRGVTVKHAKVRSNASPNFSM